MAALTAWVKGDPEKKILGDCPFSHRVLLTLETKGVKYDKDYIDFSNKPDWLQEKASGKVPVINDDGHWVPDSAEIVKYLEDKFPEPTMKPGDTADVGSSLFPAFVGFLKATSADEDLKDKELKLLNELQAVEDALNGTGTKFFGGNNLNDTDASLAPKLHHIDVAISHFKQTDLMADYPRLR